jgi:hypothetical protein
LPYGRVASKIFVDYHLDNGGVSQYEKFNYFLKESVQVHAVDQGPSLEILLHTYVDYA